MNEIQFLKNKFYISILNGNLEFIDFIDYGYVQNYIFYFATIFHATLYGGMLGHFAEGSAPAHTVLSFCTIGRLSGPEGGLSFSLVN